MNQTTDTPATTETMLRHGYTLESLSRLSHYAARRKMWHHNLALPERIEIAWSAMAEHLYASDDPPAVGELIGAGWHAIRKHAEARSQFLGHNTDAPYAGTTRPRFEAYWQHVAQPVHGLDDGIIDRLALAQIWPRLRPSHQQALAALAAHDDYTQAAQSLDKTYATFKCLISSARKEFLALWHEGETPSRPWVRDRRAVNGTDQHTMTYFLRDRRLRRNRRNQAQQPATSDKDANSHT